MEYELLSLIAAEISGVTHVDERKLEGATTSGWWIIGRTIKQASPMICNPRDRRHSIFDGHDTPTGQREHERYRHSANSPGLRHQGGNMCSCYETEFGILYTSSNETMNALFR